MNPRRPRKGMPGHRARQAGARRRSNLDSLQAHARRLERDLTHKPGRRKKA
jgi:hypothetical protein